MYLHIGQDTVIKEDEIVGIFDMDNTTSSKWTRRMLERYEREGLTVNVFDDIPKSFIVVTRKGKTIVYLSQLNTATLRQRTGAIVPEG